MCFSAYGTNITDPRLAPHGPVFTMHPTNLVVVPDSRSSTEGEHLTISVECFADGIPAPTYRIVQTRDNGTVVTITADYDPRYTLTGGRYTVRISCGKNIRVAIKLQDNAVNLSQFCRKCFVYCILHCTVFKNENVGVVLYGGLVVFVSDSFKRL